LKVYFIEKKHRATRRTELVFFDYFDKIIPVDDPNDCDMIMCYGHLILKNVLKIKEKYNKPLGCFLWDLPINEPRKVRGYSRQLKQCDLVVCPTLWLKNLLKDKGIESIRVNPFFHDEKLDLFGASGVKRDAIQISRFSPLKRFDVSSRATAGICNLSCFGPKTDGTNGKFVIDPLTDYKHVEVNIGWKDRELYGALKSSRVLLSPSVFEGFGITIAEAIKCNVPVIASDIEVFKELWGDAIIYHKKDDVGDLREKLTKLLKDGFIIDKARKVMETFTTRNHAKEIEGVLYENMGN
jgi:glycosyltransferase involved in cell wall biosynthesis